MTLAELIAAFRLESDDRVTPYLWSDAEIAGYLAEAENEACIRARLLFDETTIGVASLAVVRAVTEAADPAAVVKAFQALWETH